MRQLLGALLGCGWTVENVLDLSFDQMSEVARCIYAHKIQMYEMVMEPIAAGLSKGSKRKGKRRGSLSTQRDLRQSGLSPAQRDKILVDKLAALGFKT